MGWIELGWAELGWIERLDPQPRPPDRIAQVRTMMEEASWHWNWEVWPQWEDPKQTHPLRKAQEEAKRQGWPCNQG